MSLRMFALIEVGVRFMMDVLLSATGGTIHRVASRASQNVKTSHRIPVDAASLVVLSPVATRNANANAKSSKRKVELKYKALS